MRAPATRARRTPIAVEASCPTHAVSARSGATKQSSPVFTGPPAGLLRTTRNDGVKGGAVLTPSEERHLAGLHGHEQHIGVKRQAGFIGDRVAHRRGVHARLGNLA